MNLLRLLIMMQIEIELKKEKLKGKVYKLFEMILLLKLIQYLMWKKLKTDSKYI